MKERGDHKSRGPRGRQVRCGRESATACVRQASGVHQLPGHHPPGASNTLSQGRLRALLRVPWGQSLLVESCRFRVDIH